MGAGTDMFLQTHPLPNFLGHMPPFTFWPNTDEVQVFPLIKVPLVLILTMWNLCI